MRFFEIGKSGQLSGQWSSYGNEQKKSTDINSVREEGEKEKCNYFRSGQLSGLDGGNDSTAIFLIE
jgi:hypothetical protein